MLSGVPSRIDVYAISSLPSPGSRHRSIVRCDLLDDHRRRPAHAWRLRHDPHGAARARQPDLARSGDRPGRLDAAGHLRRAQAFGRPVHAQGDRASAVVARDFEIAA
jgi:hypothetical protein